MFKVYKDTSDDILDDRYKHDYLISEVGGRSMFIETYLDISEEISNFQDECNTQPTLDRAIEPEFQEYMDTVDTFEEAFNLIKMYQTME